MCIRDLSQKYVDDLRPDSEVHAINRVAKYTYYEKVQEI